jgi:hypothetical protein
MRWQVVGHEWQIGAGGDKMIRASDQKEDGQDKNAEIHRSYD